MNINFLRDRESYQNILKEEIKKGNYPEDIRNSLIIDDEGILMILVDEYGYIVNIIELEVSFTKIEVPPEEKIYWDKLRQYKEEIK